MPTFMQYEQDLGPLPVPEGRNRDVVSAVFVVQTDGVETSRQDVVYDPVSRMPVASTPWEAEKGKTATLGIANLDDDGNLGEFVYHEFGVAKDTLTPGEVAPEQFGTTRVIDEVDHP